MSIGEDSGPIHPVTTRLSGYRYLFSKKHHGAGPPDAARWLPDLGHDEEFAIFDRADLHELSDERGHLYGLRIGRDGSVMALGTYGQQVAVFPTTREGQTWHGYPLWPLKEEAPRNRQGQKHRPSKSVFLKMEATGLLSARDRKRLQARKLS